MKKSSQKNKLPRKYFRKTTVMLHLNQAKPQNILLSRKKVKSLLTSAALPIAKDNPQIQVLSTSTTLTVLTQFKKNQRL